MTMANKGRILLKLKTMMLRVATMDAWPKDPDPKNWRTIEGTHVHLKNGKIDGGAGGKFNGNIWSGKQKHNFMGPKIPAQIEGAPANGWKAIRTLKHQVSLNPEKEDTAKGLAELLTFLESNKAKRYSPGKYFNLLAEVDNKTKEYFVNNHISEEDRKQTIGEIEKYLHGKGSITGISQLLKRFAIKWKTPNQSSNNTNWKSTYESHAAEIDDIVKNKKAEAPKVLGNWLIKQQIYKRGTYPPFLPRDPHIAGEMAKSIMGVFDKFPRLKGWANGIQPMSMYDVGRHPNYYAQTILNNPWGNGLIEYNPNRFATLDYIKLSYEKDVKSGFHPKGTQWQSIIVHEYGHVIDEFLTKNNAASSTVKNFSDYIFSDVCKIDGKSLDEIKNLLSRYANNDHAEFFAEAIVEALTSPHPRKTASQVLEETERFMNDVNLKF